MTYVFDRKDDFGFTRWAAEIKTRDHQTCQICGRRGVELNSHHLNSWDKHEDERYLLSNGICLCRNCHEAFHDMYKRGNNTSEQFDEFSEIMESIIKAEKTRLERERITKQVLRNIEIELVLSNIDGYL